MITATTQPSFLSQTRPEMLLITQPSLRMHLLRARLVNEMSAACVVQRGDHVYLSLRDVADEAQRNELIWAVARLQMGASIHPHMLPDPLKTALLSSARGISPLLQALIWGSLAGVIGGVLIMALVGLAMIIVDAQTQFYVNIAVTAVTFVLSGTIIGGGVTIAFWRRLSRQTAVPTNKSTPPTTAKMPK